MTQYPLAATFGSQGQDLLADRIARGMPGQDLVEVPAAAQAHVLLVQAALAHAG